jgi:Protein phosphatase 2C
MSRHTLSRNNAAPPVSAAKRLRRTRNVLRIATAIVVVVAGACTATAWASRSAYLAVAGLICGIIALAGSLLLGHTNRVIVRRSAAGAGDTSTAMAAPAPAAPAALAPTPSAPAIATAATLPPTAPAKPTAQRKDFTRRRPRPLNSHHGAYALEQTGTDRLFVLAGTVLGARHEQDGVPREDDLAFAVDPVADTAVIAAVADGVGTARLSHVASALAARNAVTLLSSAWLTAMDHPGTVGPLSWPLVADSVVEKLGALLTENSVAERAGDLGMPLATEESYQRQGRPAATLAVVVVEHTADGIRASWCTVGDCQVAIADIAKGTIVWLTPVDERDVQVPAAVPIARKATRSGRDRISEGHAVLAMTDGMAGLLCHQPEHALRALAAAQVQDSALGDLLDALDLRMQGEFDDRSVVAVGPTCRDGR